MEGCEGRGGERRKSLWQCLRVPAPPRNATGSVRDGGMENRVGREKRGRGEKRGRPLCERRAATLEGRVTDQYGGTTAQTDDEIIATHSGTAIQHVNGHQLLSQ